MVDTTVVSKLDEYQQLVVDEWSDEDAVAAWHGWLAKQIGQFGPATQLIAEAAGVQAGDVLLDLGSGAGDPALTFAEIVGPSGRVVATDLVEAMALCCTENALARGLTNVESLQADAQELPFADNTFDRVTSKLGAMYFTDFQRAAAEIRRVLKPGGRLAFACWGPVEQNPYVLLHLGPFLSRLPEAPPPPPADMPGPFRFAQAGTLSAALEQAGFRDVQEHTAVVPMPWAGPPEELWQNFYDVARPVRPLIDSFSAEEREAAISEVLAGLREHYDGVYTSTPGAFVIASAVK